MGAGTARAKTDLRASTFVESAHYLDGSVGKPLRVRVPVLGQAKNDLRKLEAGRLYRPGASANVGGEPLPGVVEGLAESLDLVAGGGARGVAGEAALAGFEELLGPAVVETLGNAFAATELGNRLFAAQAVQHDADLLFGRVAFAHRPADAFDDLLGRQGVGVGFLSHLRSPEGYDEPEILPSSNG